MPIIQGTNYNDVPEVIPPIDAGIYDLKVLTADVKRNKAGDGDNLVIAYEIVNSANEKSNGRKLTQYNSISKSETNIKRVWLSTNTDIRPDGSINTDDIIGKIARGEIAPRKYKDDSGVERESSDIKNILIPKDAGYAA